MKLLNKTLIFLLTAIVLYGCAKVEKIENSATTVGSSKIIFFPTISTIGEKTIILYEGDTYTELGAEAALAGAPTTYQTDGVVNTAVPNVYNLRYIAANPEGYTAEDWRTVVVIGNDVETNDLSGTYTRNNGVTSTWTKIGKGIYTVENPGGAPVGAGLTCIAVNYTGYKIAIPKQISPDFGVISSNSEVYDPSVPPKYEWALSAGGYGTQVRFFSK
jgi:hypothetical protein